jgi:peptidoglycan hydrolase-like protein with peptidoglycan-binding domain
MFVVALLISSPAVAADEQQSSAPNEQQSSAPTEQQSPAPSEQQSASASPYAELNKQVQEILRAESFYSGPINGDFGYYTQAALAQFQLSRALPASGSLDDTTLAALGLEPQAKATDQAGAEGAGEQSAATSGASEQSASGASAPAR